MDDRIQIDRFAVENFRSIQQCDVVLTPLTILIGANGSGKTSFVDAILFVASALRKSLPSAISDRGGIHSILHHPVTLPMSLRFDFGLSSSMGVKCQFHLELKVVGGWSVSVAREECRIEYPNGDQHNYVVEEGSVKGSAPIFPPASVDRVFLANASGLPQFRLPFDFLASIGSTEPTLPGMHLLIQRLNRINRQLDSGYEDTGLAARVRNLAKSQPARLEIIQQYLRAIAPPFDHLEVIESNDTLWLQFVEKSSSGASTPFYLTQASAGLVNATETLVELFELPSPGKPVSTFIVEEPEALLHPGAIQVIRDSFVEASKTRQVLVTTHSPDLLDDPDIPAEWIRAVSRDGRGTHVEVLDPATRSVIRDNLYTAGELLRQGGLVVKP